MMFFSTGTGLERVGRRWAGPGLLAGWFAGSWIAGAEMGLLQYWTAGSGRGSPLQKQERMGVDEGFARGRSDA